MPTKSTKHPLERNHFYKQKVQEQIALANTPLNMKIIPLATVSLAWGLASAFAPNQVFQNKRMAVLASTMEANDINADMVDEYMPSSLFPPIYNRAAIASHRLSPVDIQRAIVDVKKFVENRLEMDLNLIKVSTIRKKLLFLTRTQSR